MAQGPKRKGEKTETEQKTTAKAKSARAAKADQIDKSGQTGEPKRASKADKAPEPAKPAKAKPSKTAKAAKTEVQSDTAKPLSRTLLELHLQHELNRLRGERFVQELRAEVRAFMPVLQRLTLNDWVSPEQIMAVIRRNVVDLKIAGGITELAGDMVNRIYTSKAHRDARLKDIMTAKQFEEFVEKILSLKSHRQRLVSQLLGHPVYSELVSRIVYQGIVQYLAKSNLTGSNIPGVSAVFKFGKKMVDKAAPDLEANLEAGLKTFIGKNMRFFIQQSETFLNETLSDRQLKGTIMDFWDAIESKSMKDFQKGIDALDLSEFVVLGYEFWLKYRKTRHFEGACRTVVEGIFEKYGSQPISVLLDDMGVSEAMILTEAEAFAPRIAEVLQKDGYLEERLRLRLESFYYSEDVQKLL